LAYVQLITQPYYSSVINNYRFAIYSAIGIFSVYTVVLIVLGIAELPIITTISPFVLILLFVIAYKLNSIYYHFALKRIFKKFREKQLVTSLKESVSPEEDEFHPGTLKKRSIYKSVERISMLLLLLFFFSYNYLINYLFNFYISHLIYKYKYILIIIYFIIFKHFLFIILFFFLK